MKTKNIIILFFMCICLALLSGCSQDSGGEPVTTPAVTSANTSAAENADNEESSSTTANTESNAADTSSEETEVTEAENQPADELFAYYDLLSAEYEKCGKLYTLTNNVTVTGTGKIIGNDYSHLSVYDVEKNAITAEMNALHNYNDVYYMDDDNGYFYLFEYRNWDDCTWSKYDNSGNLIAQIKYDSYGAQIMPDGTLFHRSADSYNCNMYSPDWQTKTELPILQAEVEHGLKKDIKDYFIVASYGNKVYAYSLDKEATGYYCLNTDTMTWSAVESELNETFPSYDQVDGNYFSSNEIIGRYLFVKQRYTDTKKVVGKIYDMETDTVIATISDYGFSYSGRNYSLGLRSGVLTKCQYPGDGSEEVTEIILDTEDKQLQTYYYGKDTICPFDEQYYVYGDEYGIFLREYGKGGDGEITIMMFEN